MCGNSFIAGITLPDDIQLSLTSDESELSPDAGSPDSHQSASRATEAGWDSLLCCPMHNQPLNCLLTQSAYVSFPPYSKLGDLQQHFCTLFYRIVFIVYSLSMEEIPGQSPRLYQCSQTVPLCMTTMNLIDCFILISHDNSSSFVERYVHTCILKWICI